MAHRIALFPVIVSDIESYVRIASFLYVIFR